MPFASPSQLPGRKRIMFSPRDGMPSGVPVRPTRREMEALAAQQAAAGGVAGGVAAGSAKHSVASTCAAGAADDGVCVAPGGAVCAATPGDKPALNLGDSAATLDTSAATLAASSLGSPESVGLAASYLGAAVSPLHTAVDARYRKQTSLLSQ
jgi:hypothetical protein